MRPLNTLIALFFSVSLSNSYAQQDSLIPFRINDKWGFSDVEGNIKIPVIYDEVDFYEGNFAVVKQEAKYGIINRQGRQVIPCKYDWINNFSEGLAIVDSLGWHEYEKYSHYGYIDTAGKTIIPFQYGMSVNHMAWGSTGCNTDRFINNRTIVYNEDFQHGVIDRNNKIIIPLDYDFIFRTNDGAFCTTIHFSNGIKHSYDSNGTRLFGEYESVYPLGYHLLLAIRNDSTSLINYKTNKIIDFNYKHMGSITSHLLFVTKDDSLWGCIDHDGKVIIEPVYQKHRYPIFYDETKGFDMYYKDRYISVMKNNKWGCLDTFGLEIIPCIYENEIDFESEYAVVKMKGKWGIINKKNDVVIPIQYDALYPDLRLDLVYVKEGQNHSIINFKGEKIIDSHNESITILNKNYDRLMIDETEINNQKKYRLCIFKDHTVTVIPDIINFNFDLNHNIIAYTDKGCSYINLSQRKPIVDFKYDNIVQEENGLLRIEKRTKNAYSPEDFDQKLVGYMSPAGKEYFIDQ